MHILSYSVNRTFEFKLQCIKAPLKLYEIPASKKAATFESFTPDPPDYQP